MKSGLRMAMDNRTCVAFMSDGQSIWKAKCTVHLPEKVARQQTLCDVFPKRRIQVRGIQRALLIQQRG